MSYYMRDGSAMSNNSIGEDWLVLGDSITQYMNDAGITKTVADAIGVNYFVYALAGATWEVSGSTNVATNRSTALGQVANLKQDVSDGLYNPSVITLAFGTNCTNAGSFSDAKGTSSMVSAMKTVIEDLLTTYDVSKVRIGGIIPPQATGRNPETNDSIKARNDLIRRVYEYYSIPYLDLEKAGYILDANVCNNGTMGDTVHPSAIGNKVYARRLIGWIPTL